MTGPRQSAGSRTSNGGSSSSLPSCMKTWPSFGAARVRGRSTGYALAGPELAESAPFDTYPCNHAIVQDRRRDAKNLMTRTGCQGLMTGTWHEVHSIFTHHPAY